MKKNILIMILINILTSVFAQEDFYIHVSKTSPVYDYQGVSEDFYQEEGDVLFDGYFRFVNRLVDESFYIASFEDEEENQYFISVDDISNSYCDGILPFDFCTLKSNQRFLYPLYVVKAVNNTNRNIIAVNDKRAVDSITYEDGEAVSRWYYYSPWSLMISNVGLVLGGAYGRTNFLVHEIVQITESEFELDTICFFKSFGKSRDSIYPEFHDGDEVTLRLKKDGDYLYIYVGEETKPRQTCCYVNNDFVAAVNQLVQSNWCDTTNLVWPKHADGTCEFER